MKKFILSLFLSCISICSFAVTYYSKPSAIAVDPTVLTNWYTGSSGTGTNPSSFTGGDSWTAQTAGGLTASSAWVLTGNLSITTAFTITGTPTITGTITIYPTGTLTLNTGGIVSAGGNITNNGILSVSSGTTLDMGTGSVISGTGTFPGSGKITSSNTSSSPLPASASWSGTVEYANGGGGQKIMKGTYNNLTCSNSTGTNTTSGAIIVNGALSNASGTFSTAYQLSGSLTSISNSGIISTTVLTTTTPTPIPSGKSWPGTIQYSTSAQTIVPGTYTNLNISNTSTTVSNVASGDIVVTGNFNNVTGIVDLGTNALSIGGTVTNTGTIKTSNTSGSPLSPGLSWPGSVTYATSGQTVVGGTYATLTMSNTTGTNTASGDLVVNTKLITTSGGTLNMGANVLSGTLTTLTNNGTISTSVPTTTSSTPLPSGKTWAGTVIYNAAGGAQTVAAGIYNNLTSNGSGSNTANGAVTVNGALTIASGNIFDMSVYKLAGTLSSITINGTLNTACPTSTSNPPIPASKSWPGTVQYTALAGAQSVASGTYTNLSINNTSGTDAASGTKIAVLNSLTTTSGGIFDLGTLCPLDVTTATIINNGSIKTSVQTTTSATPITPNKSWGGEVYFGGATSVTMTAVPGTYNNLTVNNCTANASGDLTVNGALNTLPSGTLKMGTSAVLKGTLASISNYGRITTTVLSSYSTTPLPPNKNWAGSGLVYYYSTTGGQTIVSGTYKQLSMLNTSGTNTAGGDITIDSLMSYGASGVLDMSTYALIGNNITVKGGGALQTQSTSALPLPANITWGLSVEYNNPSGGQTIVSGTYSSLINNSVASTNTLSSNILVTSKLKLNSGTLDDGGNTITLKGSIIGNATHTGTGLINLIGRDTIMQSISGATLGNITINNGPLNTSRLYLAGNLTVNGNINLNGLSLDIDSNNLIMSIGSTLTGTFGSNNKIITSGIGQLQLYTNGVGSLLFPIGDSFSHYTPIALNVTGGTFSPGASFVGVNVSNTIAPFNANTTNYLNRYWNIATSGITSPTYDLTAATYATGDINGTESNIATGVYNTALPWLKLDAANTGTHVLTATGLTASTATITGISAIPPSFSITPSTTTICNGSSVGLAISSPSGDPALTYSWAPASSLSASTGTSVTASPTSTQIYTVTITDGNGLTATATATVQVDNVISSAGTISSYGTTCVGHTDTMMETVSGGTWSTSDVTKATIDATTGVLTGVANGSVNVTYTLTNACSNITATATETIGVVASISGTLSVCQGLTTSLTDASAGGIWSSDASGTASIDAASGVVTGASAGTANITYTIPATWCWVSAQVTVNATPSATYSANPGSPLCTTNSATYTTQSGQSSYTWGFPGTLNTDYTISSGGNTSSSSTTLVWLTPGTKTVTVNYSNSSGCTSLSAASNTITVNATPSSITSTTTICTGLTSTLADLTSSGVWSSSNSGLASVNSSTGVVTGVAAGNPNITYTVNGCFVTTPLTINTSPTATYSANPSSPLCTTNSATYTTASGQSSYTWGFPGTLNTDYTISSGGTTSSNSTTLVWLTAGTKTVTVNYSNSNGCTSLSAATNTITVNATPSSITGTTTICTGLTSALADLTSSGVWSSSNSGLASVNSSTGVVTGVAAGNPNITYTVNGCFVTTPLTINTTPGSITASATTICINATSNLTDATPSGTWSSATPSKATIDASTGVVTGVASGSVVLSYSLIGCVATKTITVSSSTAPAAITGTSVICNQTSTTLADITSSGSWSSSATGTATINSSGVMTGVAAGVANISYTVGSCFAVLPITINPNANSITGATAICSGKTVTLGETTSGGTWSTSNSAQATVDASGVVTGAGIVASNPVISYTLGNGCFKTTTETVNPIAAISGANTVCKGSTITLTDAVASGTWASSNTTNATVTSGGVVTGAFNSTTATITYTVGSCKVTFPITINLAPFGITGTTTICSGFTSSLADVTPSGTWSTSDNTLATINSSGVLTGVAGGNPVVSYTLSDGCYSTAATTINASPAAIVAPTTVLCVGNVTTFTDATALGTWSSNHPTIASVTSSGVDSGITASGAVISYTGTNGCYVTQAITVVSNTVNTISGTPIICAQDVVTLSESTSGGTWACSNGSLATIGSSTGILTGVAAGNPVITYTAGACYRTTIATVNTNPIGSISGTASICSGTTTTLSDGTPSGTWSSSSSSVASVNSSGVMSGASVGTATITYSSGSCYVVYPVSVNTNASAITGAAAICSGATVTLGETTSGGTWGTSNSAQATVDASGVVTGAGIVASNPVISYTLGNGCFRTTTETVNPIADISGANTVCKGSTITLADAVASGTWTSSNTSNATVTSGGVVTGALNSTTVTITYTVGSCTATLPITINLAPFGITGTTTICSGYTSSLADVTPSGTWSTSDNTLATINSSGVLTGVAGGNPVVSYTLSDGCYSTAATTINASPAAIVAPTTVLCVGNVTTFTDATALGTWSSNHPTIASVTSSGVDSGITASGAVISYTGTNGCYVTQAITVVSNTVNTISGTPIICAQDVVTLSESTSGGTWACSNGSLATIGSSTGILTGVAAGNPVITYTAGACYRTTIATVNTNPIGSISGTASICSGTTTTLSDGTPSGTWSSSSSSVASVNSSGVMSGASVGTATITYSSGSCYVVYPVSVNTSPSAITGAAAICSGKTVTIGESTSGGTWGSSNSAQATVDASGVVTGAGIIASNPVISYTLGNGCFKTTTETVNPIADISGSNTVCKGSTITLTNAVASGTWTSSNTTNATVTSGGVVTGAFNSTTATITYTVGSCKATFPITINLAPFGITGTTTICTGFASSLADVTASGTWSTSDNTLATINSSGVITGVAAGNPTVSYTLSDGCYSIAATTINTTPSAIVAPTTVLCVGNVATFADATPSGTWSANHPTVATVTSSGVDSGIAAGGSTITYTGANGCYVTQLITVVSNTVNSITGTKYVCTGSNTTLASTTSGGTWSSSDGTLATVGSSTGAVTGVAGGTPVITYTGSACYKTAIVTVNVCRSADGSISSEMVNNEASISYTVYPNPAKTYIMLEQSTNVDMLSDIKVINYMGQSVINTQISFTNGKAKMDLAGIANGIYFVELKDNIGAISTFKVTVQY